MSGEHQRHCFRLTNVEQDASRSSAAHEVERLIDVLEPKLVSDDTFVADLAGLSEAHQPRDVACGLALTAFGPLEHLVEVQRQCVNLDLFAGYPDQNAAALLGGKLIAKLDQ